MEQILEILEKDSRITPEQIAVMLDKDPAAVAAAIKAYEKDGTIVGYKTLVNWEKTMKESVTAFIELKVTPQFGEGFDKIAKKIYQHDCVRSIYLMSGGFDLAVTVEGRTLKEVALFVSERLAPMDSVISTSTHFVLKKYKDYGVVFSQEPEDERRMITL
ncbi:MAG TPA: Lrp/AsnC family transcriptional regulator [Candidatus Aphodoplasma excrementigallinarum]|uniref:Lrp/AsnC family transcriptional regulator n=1 Tax=Candidatus Aphodoplasma excrementigallinarum TaxID=2840673 RepID=A0A9D1SZB7_9FIRM|nr:Lrp/AsnC family transcriptional regulator [Candidatus Aphodoplasma excrementigallinarum]